MNTTKALFSILAMFSMLLFTSCGDDDSDDGDDPIITPTEELRGSIGTRTLDANTIYVINGYAYVDDGDVLTIPAGTILKAEDGTGANASALIVARGGKLNANGTASNPVIFTSVQDNIEVGETASSLSGTDAGKWGGLIMLGKAPVSVKPSESTDGVGKEGSIEGVPSGFSFSLYGGDDANDNSGTLNYVSIRFTGTELSPNNEIQGLTLGGVGSGTSISNIEIFASKDDGVECFGGTVDIDNILIAYQQDDGIDLDQNYSGTIDNGLVLLFNSDPGNDGMEIDGPEASGVNDGGYFTVSNTTVYQNGGANIARLKSNAQGTISNFAAKGFNGQTLLLDGAHDVTLENSEFNGSEIESITETDVDMFASNGNMFDVTNFTKGANESSFDWTYAKEQGLF